jgi:hypothetical protein
MIARALGSLVLFIAVTAAADVSTVSSTPTVPGRFVSASIMLGGLHPDVDSTTGLSGAPYATTLGGGNMLFVQAEVDWFLWHKVGALGVGFSAGYGEKYHQANYTTGGVAPVKTSLQLIPLKLNGVYRFDYAAEHWGVPLVPYAKLGLIYEPWWASTGGSIDTFNGQRGAGGQFGWGWTGGLAFLLDVLNPAFAKDMEVDSGIFHSYLFGEFTMDRLPGFSNNGINLSNSRFMFGLAFDF